LIFPANHFLFFSQHPLPQATVHFALLYHLPRLRRSENAPGLQTADPTNPR
jgi:hypothetical protein